MRQVTQLVERRRGRYVIVFEHELETLDALPLWQTRLFTALVRLSNWTTGQGQTTYAALVALLTPLQAGNGGRRHYAPDAQAIRRALRAFERVGLVRTDSTASQRGERLFFELDSRQAKVRPLFSSDKG